MLIKQLRLCLPCSYFFTRLIIALQIKLLWFLLFLLAVKATSALLYAENLCLQTCYKSYQLLPFHLQMFLLLVTQIVPNSGAIFEHVLFYQNLAWIIASSVLCTVFREDSFVLCTMTFFSVFPCISTFEQFYSALVCPIIRFSFWLENIKICFH